MTSRETAIGEPGFPHDLGDEVRFTSAMRTFPTGIALVTALDASRAVGLTCQSLINLSFEPPMIGISVMETSTTFPRIRTGGEFCVNILADDQEWMSRQFGRSGDRKWHGITWHPGVTGSPRIDGCVSWIECSIASEQIVGDHTFVIGRVRAFALGSPSGAPLIYLNKRYGSFAARPAVPA